MRDLHTSAAEEGVAETSSALTCSAPQIRRAAFCYTQTSYAADSLRQSFRVW